MADQPPAPDNPPPHPPEPHPPEPRRVTVHLTLEIPEGSTVRVTARAEAGQPVAVTQTVHGPAAFAGLQRWRTQLATWPLATTLFGLGLVVYAFTRFIALDQFPIYFFADETANALYAEDLLARGFRDAQGNLFPLYFEAAALRWTPLLSVYIHAVTVALFGKSLLVTRLTSAAVTLLGAAAVSLVLRDGFKTKSWWTGVLFMALAPAWFLHSRTAFETAIMVALFAAFLWCYLRYRLDDPRWVYPALFCGAAAFYTYSNGQSLLGVTGGLLFLVDLRYHWAQRRHTLPALGVALALAVPVLGFRLQHPEAFGTHLRAIDSVLFQNLSWEAKLAAIAQNYWQGLSPQYWFWPHELDLPRHTMRSYGHLLLATLPFTALGFAVCVWHWRSAPHRTLLIAMLAVPVGAALVGVGITRVLAFVVPAAVFAALGLEETLTRGWPWLQGRVAQWQNARWVAPALPWVVFAVLAGGSLNMFRDALTNGPLWYSDYGLYGMQYGAKQLFQDTLPGYLRREPQTTFEVSSTWANGADAFVRFFLPTSQWSRVPMRNIDYYLDNPRPLTNTVLILTPGEFQQAASSGKFLPIQVDQVLPYPDGSPGFYFARLQYVPNVEALFAAEIAARRQPITETLAINGEVWYISHSRFDMGEVHHIFDGDTFTLARGQEANPLVLDITFPTARPMTGVSLDLGAMTLFEVQADVFIPGAASPQIFSQTFQNLPADPHVVIPFAPLNAPVQRVVIYITNRNAGDTANIHVREVQWEK